jgi:predicted permease
MFFFKILASILTVISLVSIFYKIYLQVIIKNPKKKGSFFSVFIRFPTIMDILPLSLEPNNSEENRMRKKANKALAIFYLGFILIILISLIA